MSGNYRGIVFIILYMFLIFAISVLWNMLEVCLYGYSQKSIMDVLFCIQPSYTIANKVTDLLHKMAKTRKQHINEQANSEIVRGL